VERQLNVSCLSFSGKRFYSFPRLSREVGVRVLNWTERGGGGSWGEISIEKKVVVVARNKHVAGKTRFSSVTFKMRSRKILTLKRNLNSSYTHVSRIYGFTLGNKAAH